MQTIRLRYYEEDNSWKYKIWIKDGAEHRLDGPACEYSTGRKEWYIEGRRHRLDGPAIEDSGGYKSWWIEGNHLTEEQFNERTNH